MPGLGLPIVVAGTVAAHGGTVTVSQSPDGGARFEIHLPL
ncbi:ATP-binding protein [Rhodococcus sp. EPR-157]